MHAILAEAATKYFWLPKQASTVAGGIDDLFNAILYICIFFFLLVTVLLVAFVIIYRHKPGQKRDVSASHSMTLEITWTVIPSIIVVFLYYYGFKEYMNLAVEPPNAYTVTVTGRMWQWSFAYPEGYSTGELHVPVNVPIRCVLESDDVIHSLSIPAFRIKKDVVPGRYNRTWFEANTADGALYVVRVEKDKHVIEMGFDQIGNSLSESTHPAPQQTSVEVKNLPAPVLNGMVAQAVQNGLTAQEAGSAVSPDVHVSVYHMLNGATLYSGAVEHGGKTVELLVDQAGAPPAHDNVQLDSLPHDVQNAIQQAFGGGLPATQQVMRFLDAEAFEIYCTDYCGTNHSTMHSRVIVHRTQADFDAWLKKAIELDNTGTPAEKGQKLYTRLGCVACHSVDGRTIVGPTWKDLYGSTQHFTDGSTAVVNEEFIHGFLPNPTARVPVGFNPVMPPFAMLSNEQMDSIAAYMRTISKFAPPPSMSSGVGVGTTKPSTRPATAPADKTPGSI